MFRCIHSSIVSEIVKERIYVGVRVIYGSEYHGLKNAFIVDKMAPHEKYLKQLLHYFINSTIN